MAAGAAGVEALLDKLGPDMIRALSPTEGLHVTSHVFQAIEQEGRWKSSDEFPERGLFRVTDTDPSERSDAAEKYKKRKDSILRAAEPVHKDAPVLTIVAGQPSGTSKGEFGLGALAVQLNKLLAEKGISVPFPAKSEATISAKYWADGQEIWAGLAGLKRATGFTSLFDSQAAVQLNGVTYGNYFPMSYFLSFTGFVNLIGPEFIEFRGGVLLKADGDVKPLFCETWSRGGELTISQVLKPNEPVKPPMQPQWNKTKGYIIELGMTGEN